MKEVENIREHKSINDIIENQGQWLPLLNKVINHFKEVRKTMPKGPDSLEALNMTGDFLDLLNMDIESGRPVLKQIGEFLLRKPKDQPANYETFSKGLKPGELYSTLADLNEMLDGEMDIEAIGEKYPQDRDIYLAEKKKEKELYNKEIEQYNLHGKYSIEKNEELYNGFLGNYTQQELNTNNYGPISLERTGGHSISFFHLLKNAQPGKRAERLDEIYAPDKLLDEKQQTFDTVVKYSKSLAKLEDNAIKNHPNAKALVDMIFDGINAAMDTVDELADKLDMSKDGFTKTETFIKMVQLGHMIHDAWQEICRFPSLMDEKLKGLYPELKTEKERYDAYSGIAGSLSSMYADMNNVTTAHKDLVDKKKNVNLIKYLNGSLSLTQSENLLRKWKTSGIKKLSDFFKADNTGYKYDLIRSQADRGLDHITRELSDSIGFDNNVDKRISDGSLFKNVTYDQKKGFGNLPKLDYKNKDFIIPGPVIGKGKAEPEENIIKVNEPEEKTIKENEPEDLLSEQNKFEDDKIIIDNNPENNNIITDLKSDNNIEQDKNESAQDDDSQLEDNKEQLIIEHVNPKKLPVGYDSYMKLHTYQYGLKAKTIKDKELAVSKVLAAYSLQKIGIEFSIKEIHKMADHISKTYAIGGHLKTSEADSILKNVNNVLRYGEEKRKGLYDIKPESYDDFIKDMKSLSQNMISESEHSKEYKALAKAIRKAANLNTVGMSPENKARAFRNANLNVVHAADKYMEGKEKVRRTTSGNDCFKNALDAIAISSKYNDKKNEGHINQRVSDIIHRINKVRGKNQPLDETNFESKYGADRAKERHLEIQNKNNKSKNQKKDTGKNIKI